MMLYCDESGGVGAGVMTLAAVALPAKAAGHLLERTRDVLGIRGELKGSRLDVAQRGFVVELFARLGGRAIITEARVADLTQQGRRQLSDLDIYTAMLEHTIAAWLPQSGGRVDVTIDDGRYDQMRNSRIRDEIQASIGNWGHAALSDSRLSPGVQIADVMSNSHFHVAVNGRHTRRVTALLEPFWADGSIRRLELSRIGQ